MVFRLNTMKSLCKSAFKFYSYWYLGGNYPISNAGFDVKQIDLKKFIMRLRKKFIYDILVLILTRKPSLTFKTGTWEPMLEEYQNEKMDADKGRFY